MPNAHVLARNLPDKSDERTQRTSGGREGRRESEGLASCLDDDDVLLQRSWYGRRERGREGGRGEAGGMKARSTVSPKARQTGTHAGHILLLHVSQLGMDSHCRNGVTVIRQTPRPSSKFQGHR